MNFTTGAFVPPTVSLSSDVSDLDEAGGAAVVSANLDFQSEDDISITLAFAGDASASDYSASATTIAIAAGATTGSVTVTAVQDPDPESTESIEITVMSATNATAGSSMVTLSIIDDDKDSNGDGFPDQGLIVNEVLYDPPSDNTAGDANGDGTRSASQDEFIEFYNDSDVAIDMSGFTLYDNSRLGGTEPRHTFADPTIIPPGTVYVLFGGGTPTGTFGGAQVAATTTGSMNLTNGGDAFTILDTQGNEFFKWDSAVDGAGFDLSLDVGLTRSPDINGPYVFHTDASSLTFSPGTLASGMPFGAPPAASAGFIINEVLYDPPSDIAGDANGDGTRSASEDEFIEFVNDTDAAVDLSGFTIFDAAQLGGTPRHVFPAGSIIPARSVFVLFGGGTPTGTFGGAMVAASSTGSLHMTNGGDVVTILDASGNVFMVFDSTVEGPGINFGSDISVTRSPDLTGDFMLHTGVAYSPGTRANGSSFY